MIERYCECGAGIRLVGDETLLPAWERAHDGDGHERVSAGEARAIRVGARDPMVRKTHARDVQHPTWARCGTFGFGPTVTDDDAAVTCEHCRKILADER